MIYIFNRSWVDTRWQQYITHLHTNSTHNTEIGKYYTGRKIGKCGPCPVFANYILAFALQLRKKHGKSSVRVGEWSRTRWSGKSDVIKAAIVLTGYLATLSVSRGKQRRMGRSSDEW
jgi:hypothetical protein